MATPRPPGGGLDPGGEQPPMMKEIEIGTSWWSDQLTEVPSTKVDIFKSTLQSLLFQHYQGHWDPTNVMKGSGYRSITADTYRLDPLLVQSCDTAQISIEDFCRLIFKRGTDHIMFINPGEVRIRNGVLLTTSSSLIWSANPQPQGMGYSSSITPSGLSTPGGSLHNGQGNNNMNPSTANSVHQTSLSRGGIFTPTNLLPSHLQHHNTNSSVYIPPSQLSQHGSLPQSAISASAYHPTSTSQHNTHNTTSNSVTQSGHLHRNAIHAPAWTPDNNNDYERHTRNTPRKG